MRKFIVAFEVFRGNSKEMVHIPIEAGTKKLAALRAMQEINKRGDYSMLYKNIISINEVAV